jgi:hypothetical protein
VIAERRQYGLVKFMNPKKQKYAALAIVGIFQQRGSKGCKEPLNPKDTKRKAHIQKMKSCSQRIAILILIPEIKRDIVIS